MSFAQSLIYSSKKRKDIASSNLYSFVSFSDFTGVSRYSTSEHFLSLAAWFVSGISECKVESGLRLDRRAEYDANDELTRGSQFTLDSLDFLSSGFRTCSFDTLVNRYTCFLAHLTTTCRRKRKKSRVIQNNAWRHFGRKWSIERFKSLLFWLVLPYCSYNFKNKENCIIKTLPFYLKKKYIYVYIYCIALNIIRLYIHECI